MATAMERGREVRAKKKCCKSGPRCKKCPVVLKRLSLAGHAERTGKRTYVVDAGVPKKAVKAARAKRAPAAPAAAR
jgi:hypothetical protein